jgi:hypothetical protein
MRYVPRDSLRYTFNHALPMLAMFSAVTFVSPAAAQPRDVDLDAPGALESLSRDDPTRYATVVRVLDDASRIAPAAARGLLHVRYHADDVELAQVLMTSFPAKRRLSFRLDEVTFRATVSVLAPVAGSMPAAQPR